MNKHSQSKQKSSTSSSRKTFKREVALGLLVLFCYVVTQGDVEMVKVLVWPVFSFAGLAFGLDWYGKKPDSTASDTPTVFVRQESS